MIPAVAALAAASFCSSTSKTPSEAVDAYISAYNSKREEPLMSVLSQAAHVREAGEATGLSAEKLLELTPVRRAGFPAMSVESVGEMAEGNLVVRRELIRGAGSPVIVLGVYRVDNGCIMDVELSR